jgi:hypothetical protein
VTLRLNGVPVSSGWPLSVMVTTGLVWSTMKAIGGTTVDWPRWSVTVTVSVCLPSCSTVPGKVKSSSPTLATVVVLVRSSMSMVSCAGRFSFAPLANGALDSKICTAGALLSMMNAIGGTTVTWPTASVTVTSRVYSPSCSIGVLCVHGWPFSFAAMVVVVMSVACTHGVMVTLNSLPEPRAGPVSPTVMRTTGSLLSTVKRMVGVVVGQPAASVTVASNVCGPSAVTLPPSVKGCPSTLATEV